MKIVAIRLEDLASLMPMSKIVEALDDNGDGAIDAEAWDSVLEQVNEHLITLCGSADAVRDRNPRYAAKVFAARTLYTRRGFTGKDNPIEALALAQEKVLTETVSGGTVIQEKTAFNSKGTF